MNYIGEFGLSAAVMLAAITIVTAMAAARFNSATAILLAKVSIVAVTSMFLLCSVALLTALVGSDFSLDYVARFTERSLPIGYRLAAFWAGQEGSLLLWALLLSAMSSIAVFSLNRKFSVGFSAAVIITLAVVTAFFGLLILCAANPFAPVAQKLADGQGLNPMLQDPGMIAHPPILFLGYAGFTIPFALMLAALITGRTDDRWIAATRRWVLVSWLFLTIGIILGAKWAYTTLGWGGYWAWDPVENASLLPWLTATAFVHSLMVQQTRNMFRIWNAALLAATFLLCIFGTYITRSGVVDSVHTFGQSAVGTFFCVFLVIATLFSAVLILSRLGKLFSLRRIQGLISREGAFLATNIVLMGIAVVVLIGTMYPVLSNALSGTRTTLGPAFYNHVAGPLGLLVVALMGLGPLLTYGKLDTQRLLRVLAAPVALGTLSAVAAYVFGWRSAWAAVCSFIAAGAVSVIVIDFARLVYQKSQQEKVLLAAAKILVHGHRRYGAQLAHVGVLLMIVGITASSVFKTKVTTDTLEPGSSATVAGMHLTLQSAKERQGENYNALETVVNVIDTDGRALTLTPQRRVYDKWPEQSSSVVAIDSTWKRDIYMNLAGWDVNEKTGGYGKISLEVIVNPLVSWIWIGGWVLGAGVLICLIPHLADVLAAIKASPADETENSASLQGRQQAQSRKNNHRPQPALVR
jgi:cytochrome c-type biogenesis protein CcmF